MVTDFNLKRFFHPFSILRFRRLLHRTEKYSKNQIIAYQNEQLKIIIQYAYQFVPYYTALFEKLKLTPDDILTTDDLLKLPVLTKDDIRNNFDLLKSLHLKKLSPKLVTTSGSTGTPLKIYHDKNIDICKFAVFWRIWNWEGYRLGQRWANLSGSVLENNQIVKYVRSMNALYMSSFNLTPTNGDIFLSEIIKFKPKMLRGYPSSLYEFAKIIEHHPKNNHPNLNCIATSSESLLEFQREYIQRVFRCKVFDNYSAWEHVCIIGECEYQIKHHQMEYGILELLDENNSRVNNGDIGEITATTLINHAMPLIRYKTKDLAVRSNTLCKCGRPHDVIERIDGRIEDIIVTPDGRRVGRMDAAFKHNDFLDFAKIVQNNIDSMDVYLVKNSKYNEEELNKLTKHIRNRVGDVIKINYIFTDRIKPGNNGKIRFVENNFLKKTEYLK